MRLYIFLEGVLKNFFFPTGKGEKSSDVRRCLSPMDFQDSRTKEVLSAEIHCYEFFHLVIDLLRSLCGAEPNGISAVATNISLQSVNFALENLCTLQFGGSTNVSLVTAQVAELKAAMTHLLLVALQKVSESFHNSPCYIDSVTALKYVYLTLC
jgi:hypothetical protein